MFHVELCVLFPGKYFYVSRGTMYFYFLGNIFMFHVELCVLFPGKYFYVSRGTMCFYFLGNIFMFHVELYIFISWEIFLNSMQNLFNLIKKRKEFFIVLFLRYLVLLLHRFLLLFLPMQQWQPFDHLLNLLI